MCKLRDFVTGYRANTGDGCVNRCLYMIGKLNTASVQVSVLSLKAFTMYDTRATERVWSASNQY